MITRSDAVRLRFSVACLHAWAPDMRTPDEWRAWSRGERAVGTVGEPPLSQMAPMLRRHAARLGRMACDVAYRALGELPSVPVVFCSRYGEVERSVELLTTLAASGEVSPTSFGLSVHNAISGLLSMARRDNANSMAISAGDESAAYGMLEACSLLHDGAERVLVVVADCPLPPPYERFADVEPLALAWACLVEPAGADAFALELHDASALGGERTSSPTAPASLSALRVLMGLDRECTHHTDTGAWRWLATGDRFA